MQKGAPHQQPPSPRRPASKGAGLRPHTLQVLDISPPHHGPAAALPPPAGVDADRVDGGIHVAPPVVAPCCPPASSWGQHSE